MWAPDRFSILVHRPSTCIFGVGPRRLAAQVCNGLGVVRVGVVACWCGSTGGPLFARRDPAPKSMLFPCQTHRSRQSSSFFFFIPGILPIASFTCPIIPFFLLGSASPADAAPPDAGAATISGSSGSPASAASSASAGSSSAASPDVSPASSSAAAAPDDPSPAAASSAASFARHFLPFLPFLHFFLPPPGGGTAIFFTNASAIGTGALPSSAHRPHARAQLSFM
mmetsp:Transcript_17271/g.38779  ORF Transcript_17271/g.38779 Transcript_17271/m.38779 type:complete len:225 (+) Transcript_17271:136-810(+)